MSADKLPVMRLCDGCSFFYYRQGFTEEVLRILNLTSYMSSERQLHYVLSQVAAGSEIEANSIKARMETIIKGE